MAVILNDRGMTLHEQEGRTLESAMLANKYLRGAQLQEANLRKCDLRDANLTEANLDGAVLTGAILDGANLTDASLVGASLDYTTCKTITFTRAKLNRCSFKHAVILDANFEEADASDTDFSGGIVSVNNSRMAKFRNAKFCNMQQRGQFKIYATDFRGTDFRPNNSFDMTIERDNGRRNWFPPLSFFDDIASTKDEYAINNDWGPYIDEDTKWASPFPKRPIQWFRILLYGSFLGIFLKGFGVRLWGGEPSYLWGCLVGITVVGGWNIREVLLTNRLVKESPHVLFGCLGRTPPPEFFHSIRYRASRLRDEYESRSKDE